MSNEPIRQTFSVESIKKASRSKAYAIVTLSPSLSTTLREQNTTFDILLTQEEYESSGIILGSRIAIGIEVE